MQQEWLNGEVDFLDFYEETTEEYYCIYFFTPLSLAANAAQRMSD